jgi:NADPH-dependent glutamate synthase beta subunit-like oxidoreductase
LPASQQSGSQRLGRDPADQAGVFLGEIGEKAAVIGGGNVAMDAARTAVRVGFKEVYIMYRRTEKELPARLEEIRHAKEEGIVFKFLHAPVEILEKDGGSVLPRLYNGLDLEWIAFDSRSITHERLTYLATEWHGNPDTSKVFYRPN